jgi:short subunit dehydrogenase-like uncharacterized protein
MRFDYVIFGATGFTGQFVVEHLAKALHRDNDASSTWAVSGRSESKLQSVLGAATKETGLDLTKIPLIICDINDDESVLQMASRARVVINCVGPYRFLGEQVISACVKAGTSHIDISGEVQFLEGTQLKYNDAAKDKGVYIIGACGFDSIPNDMGQMVLADKMEGDVNSVETYLEVISSLKVGARLNYGTWQSGIHMFSNLAETNDIRKRLYPNELPVQTPVLERRGPLFWSNEVGSYCIPFIGSPDLAVMRRTQRARHDFDGERPSQVQAYVVVPAWIAGAVMLLVGAIFAIVLSTRIGLYLLEKYPELFTLGLVSRSGPSKEIAESSNFKMTLVGKGWKNKAKSHSEAPNRQVTVNVSGKNAGYGATCECMVQAAIVILKEKSNMPPVGGVFAPGYAFAKTTIAQRLNAGGVLFRANAKNL